MANQHTTQDSTYLLTTRPRYLPLERETTKTKIQEYLDIIEASHVQRSQKDTFEFTGVLRRTTPYLKNKWHQKKRKRFTNDRRDWLDLSVQLLLDLVQVETIVVCQEVDRKTKMAKTTRATDTRGWWESERERRMRERLPVQVGLRVLREIKVDNNIHRRDIDTSGKQVRRDEIAACAISEVMEDTVTMLRDEKALMRRGKLRLGSSWSVCRSKRTLIEWCA